MDSSVGILYDDIHYIILIMHVFIMYYVMLHTKKPIGFFPLFASVSCFLVYKERILLLLRDDDLPYGGLWDKPTGIIHKNESMHAAMRRVAYESMGLQVAMKDCMFSHTVYITGHDTEHTAHLFYLSVDTLPVIHIDATTYIDSCWISLDKVHDIPTMPDLLATIDLIFSR